MVSAPYFQHDFNARHDPRIRYMIIKFGADAYAVYFCVIERMRERFDEADEPFLRLTSIEIAGLADDVKLQPDRVKEIIEEMATDTVALFRIENSELYSERFFREAARIKRTSDTQKDKAGKRWKKGNSDAVAMPGHSHGNAPECRSDASRVDKSRVDKIREEKHKRAHARAGACEDQPDTSPPEEQSSEPEPPEQESTTEPDLDDIENATRLMDAVNAIEPGYTKKARVNFDGWSNEFRLIRQQDHRPQADVVFVIEQFPKHEFWSRNIRSPGALRGRTSSGGDKFLKILSDLKTQKPNGATNGRAKNNAMPDPAGSRAVLKHFGITDGE